MSLEKVARSLMKLANPQIELPMHELRGSFRYEILDWDNDGKKLTFVVAGAFGPDDLFELAEVRFDASTKNADALQGMGVTNVLPDHSAVCDLFAIGMGMTEGAGLFAPIVPKVEINKEAEPLIRFLLLGWAPPVAQSPGVDQMEITTQQPAIPVNVGLIRG